MRVFLHRQEALDCIRQRISILHTESEASKDVVNDLLAARNITGQRRSACSGGLHKDICHSLMIGWVTQAMTILQELMDLRLRQLDMVDQTRLFLILGELFAIGFFLDPANDMKAQLRISGQKLLHHGKELIIAFVFSEP